MLAELQDARAFAELWSNRADLMRARACSVPAGNQVHTHLHMHIYAAQQDSCQRALNELNVCNLSHLTLSIICPEAAGFLKLILKVHTFAGSLFRVTVPHSTQ